MIFLRLAIWLTNSFSGFPGRWRVLAWIATKESQLELLPPRLINIDDGTKLLLEAFNNRGHYVEIRSLTKDVRVVRAFENILRRGDVALDVGANIGRMSVLASRLVGPTGRVFSFEPSPKVVSSLYRNLAINRCSNVVVRTFALADYDGVTCFHMPVGTNSAWGSLREIGTGASIEVEVFVRSLDSLAELPGPIRLLKIDVEGADLKVVRGAANLIRTQRPMIILEYSPDWIRQLGDDPLWLEKFLLEEGYYAYELLDNGPRRLTNFPEKQIDLLCAPMSLSQESWDGLRLPLGAD